MPILCFLEKQELILSTFFFFFCETEKYKTGVINDPLSQTHSLTHSEHCFRLKLVLFWQILKSGDRHGQTTCAKTMIPTGLDCGSAEWIKKMPNHDSRVKILVFLNKLKAKIYILSLGKMYLIYFLMIQLIRTRAQN